MLKHRWRHAAMGMAGSLALRCGGVATDGSVATRADASPPPSEVGPPPVEAGKAVDVREPRDCPPAQWLLCPTVGYLHCSPRGDGWELPTDPCACDPGGPLSEVDCKPGETFVCLKATAMGDGAPAASVIPFACQCLRGVSDCAACGVLPALHTPTCDMVKLADGGSNVLCKCDGTR